MLKNQRFVTALLHRDEIGLCRREIDGDQFLGSWRLRFSEAACSPIKQAAISLSTDC